MRRRHRRGAILRNSVPKMVPRLLLVMGIGMGPTIYSRTTFLRDTRRHRLLRRQREWHPLYATNLDCNYTNTNVSHHMDKKCKSWTWQANAFSCPHFTTNSDADASASFALLYRTAYLDASSFLVHRERIGVGERFFCARTAHLCHVTVRKCLKTSSRFSRERRLESGRFYALSFKK